MTLTLGRAIQFTIYAIRRDHSKRTQVFRVCVREPRVSDDGVGAQFRCGAIMYGASLIIRRATP